MSERDGQDLEQLGVHVVGDGDIRSGWALTDATILRRWPAARGRERLIVAVTLSREAERRFRLLLVESGTPIRTWTVRLDELAPLASAVNQAIDLAKASGAKD